MKRRISRFLLARLAAETAAAGPIEICGLLVGDGDELEDAWPIHNAARAPAATFLLDPAAQIAASRRARQEGRQIVGHYHSHPSGLATPSEADAAMARGEGAFWLIVSGTEARLWIARRGGMVHDTFDPVALEIV